MKKKSQNKGLTKAIAVFLLGIFCLGIVSLGKDDVFTTKAVETETSTYFISSENSIDTEEVKTEIKTSAWDMVDEINVGWNLGNTLDSYNEDSTQWESTDLSKEEYYETLFGNPKTTQAVIDQVAAAGFNAVRIPLTFTNHLNEENIIDDAWLNRIKEVVSYVTQNQMYCIINVHHDTGENGWLKADLPTIKTTKDNYEKLWSQLAIAFKDYDQTLIFEGYNELLDKGNNWSSPSTDSLEAANQLNQLFVDTVRSTGGNNTNRNLLVNAYGAKAEDYILKHFALPVDTSTGHLIAGIHTYYTKKTDQDRVLSLLETYFTSNHIPVIIGEYATRFTQTSQERIASAQNLIKNGNNKKIACFWWDDGNYKQEANAQCNYALLDRVSLTWYDESLVEAITGVKINEEK